MGGICTKKEPKESKPEEQDLAEQFYVETKLEDVPVWAEQEWHNLVRKTELSMDQDNFDLATQKLKEEEKIFQDNQEIFQEMRTIEEKHMIN